MLAPLWTNKKPALTTNKSSEFLQSPSGECIQWHGSLRLTAYGTRPRDNPHDLLRGSENEAPSGKKRSWRRFLSTLLSLVICSVCSTNFPMLKAYKDQYGELCPTSAHLMELVTLPQSSGLTDPITRPPSFRGEIAPSHVDPKTPCASPHV